MKCVEEAKEKILGCSNKECRYFIKHQESQNCTFICIENNGRMSLRQISDVLGTSPANIGMLEKKALKKIAKHMKKEDYRE